MWTALVIGRAAELLDATVSLDATSHSEVTDCGVDADGNFYASIGARRVGLVDGAQYRGVQREGERSVYLLVHNGLHLELVVDRQQPIGQTSASGLADVVLEAALTTIQDCEDSVAAVDADDKVVVYRNWLGLMRGDLTSELEKAGRTIVCRLNPDRQYAAPDGSTLTLPGRMRAQCT